MANRNRIHKSPIQRRVSPKTQARPAAKKWGEEAGLNTRFMQTGMEDDTTDPRPHNNYDNDATIYPPAQRW